MASARASWASGDKAPKEIPAESKRLRIDSNGSISLMASGVSRVFTLNKSRIIDTGRLSTSAVYSLNLA
ncbi:hypothetical protein [Pseudomonas sp. 22 E 5]|nr:hypothetical protein [Pseudomonas sp. 22 E 5]